MFSFYGRKKRLAKKYPTPQWDIIVEPFAGAAGYASLHYSHDVKLYDVDENIFGVWDYLINHATPKMILSLPDVDGYKVKLSDVRGFETLAPAEKALIGFCVNNGSAQPKNYSASTGNFNSWHRDKKRIAEDLWKIKHWEIVKSSYVDVVNVHATWFIDPPYIGMGKWYVHNDIDYTHLSRWCQERDGQVIVCENYGADWLEFEHLTSIPFSHYKTDADKSRKTKEAIWYRE